MTLRRQLLEAMETVDKGGTPRGSLPVTSENVRSHDDFVPKGANWREVFGDAMKAKW